jgi:hypothetical protein
VSALRAEAPVETVELEGHKTSPTIDASIGRWRNERDAQFRDLCREAFAEALDEFGYER